MEKEPIKFEATPVELSSGNLQESIAEKDSKRLREVSVLIENVLEDFNRHIEDGENQQSKLAAYKSLCGLRSEISSLHKLKKTECASMLSSIVLNAALNAIQTGCDILEEQIQRGPVARRVDLEVRPSDLIFHDLHNSVESVLGVDIKPDESILVLEAKAREIFGEIRNAKMFYRLADPEKYNEKIIELETKKPVETDPFSTDQELECYNMVRSALQLMEDRPIMQIDVVQEAQRLVESLKSN